MMKKITLLFSVFFICITYAVSQNLYKIDLRSQQDVNAYLALPDFKVFYFNDDLLIGEGLISESPSVKMIDRSYSKNSNDIFLVQLPSQQGAEYLKEVKKVARVLFESTEYLIAEISDEQIGKLAPAVHGGIVKIGKDAIRSPKKSRSFNVIYDPEIAGYVSEVISDSIMDDIQHMEDYGTRKYNTPEAIEAQNWIQNIFEGYGLTTELTSTGAGGSMNVTAYQTGLLYPNTYIMVGGHYDSYTYSSTAPGADDNASGTAAVMEIARILSQYQFNYTIIYCAWSAEEIGLYGSGAWAENAASEGMDIMGYLNLDMIGYLNSGEDLTACMIAPSSAQQLIDFYYDIVDTYISDFSVYNGALSGGDSDHTSFNNNGYQGIFPFEDCEDYSPYIHTVNDLIGPSVNSPEKAVKFTQSGVAFIATAAEIFTGLYPPMNLSLNQIDNTIVLNWDQPLNQKSEFLNYNVYRNSEIITEITDIAQTSYTDYTIQNGVTYEYYVTAVYAGDPAGESGPSNMVSVTPGLEEVYFWDFEDGQQGWSILNTAYGWRWGVPVDISGNNTEYLSIDSDDAGSGYHVFDYAISPELDMSIYSVAFLEFDYGYNQYTTDYLKLMYRTSPQSSWVEIASLPESGSFTHKTYDIPVEAFTETVQLAFYYDDNNQWAWYAAIDNVSIVASENRGGTLSSTNGMICIGSSTGTMTLTDNSGTITDWEKRYNGGSWVSIGITESSYSEIPAQTGTWDYRVVVDGGTAYSNIVSVIVSPVTVAGAVSGGTDICYGENTGIMTLTGHTGAVQRWEKQLDGGSWNVIENTDINYDENPISPGNWSYRAVVKSGACLEENSEAAGLEVFPAAVGGLVEADHTSVCTGSSVNLTLSDYIGSIQWQISEDGIDWADISGENTVSLFVNALNDDTWYRVVLSLGDCPDAVSNSVLISVFENPIAGYSFVSNNQTVTFTNTSSGALNYLWSFGDDMTSTEVNPVHVYSESGNYVVSLTASNGVCPDDVDEQNINVNFVGVEDLEMNTQIIPNPANDHVFVSAGRYSMKAIKILNLNGQTIYENKPEGNSILIDLGKYTKGLYFIEIVTETMKVTKKLIIY